MTSLFENIVQKALDDIPENFREKLDNVEIVIADFPDQHQLSKIKKTSTKGMLLGLYEGIPQTKRRSYGIGGAVPDKITIFKYPILIIAKNKDDLIKIIKDTVKHEIAHHFGMSEEQIVKTKKRGVNF